MDSRMRLTFACGACLGLAVGFAAGHLSFWDHLPRQTAQRTFDLEPMGSSGFDFPAIVPAPEMPVPTPSPGGAVVLNDPDLGDEPVHADAVVELPGEATPQPPPSALTIGTAKPLSPDSAAGQRTQQVQSLESEPLDPEVVKMLKEELQGVSEQQREIWAEALRGMTPEDATGVIFMWKKFGQTGAGHISSPPPLFSSSHPDPAPLPAAQSLKDLLPPPTTAVPSAEITRILEHNRANAETCGYLNLIPVRQELALESGNHLENSGYRLDLKNRDFRDTSNPAHVALDQQGFLAVQLTTGEVQYTRIGRLVLDGERRLCVDLGGRDLPVSPEIQVPMGTYQLTEVGGQLRALIAGQSEPVEIPALQMARFFDASRLQPQGSGLYVPTTASGPAEMVTAKLFFGVLDYPKPLEPADSP